jgi:hypothetical protein
MLIALGIPGAALLFVALLFGLWFWLSSRDTPPGPVVVDNRPINQPPNPVNFPVNPPVDPPVNPPVNPPINPPIVKKKQKIVKPAPDPSGIVPNAIAQPAPPADVAGKTTVDLIPLIDPALDTVHGKWTVDKNVLHCNHMHLVPRIQIPYQPPEEFDFVVTFSQPSLRNGVSLVMPNPSGGSFFWFIGSGAGSNYGFAGTMGNYEDRLPGLIQTNTSFTTVVQVRKDSVKGSVNGKELIHRNTDFRDLTSDNWRRINDARVLAVCCDEPTVFHYVRVVEITGTGKRTR